MNINSALLSVILLIATAPLCQARLGESETQCDVRYNPEGKKVEPSYEDKRYPLSIGQPLETVTYDYQGWKLRIGFQGGIALCMEYRRADSQHPSDAEINAILKANSARGTWQSISGGQAKTNAALNELSGFTGGGGYWLRSDGSIAYMTWKTVRLVLKKGVDIGLKAGLKQLREQEAAKQESLPTF
jgi:hypothetical protein